MDANLEPISLEGRRVLRDQVYETLRNSILIGAIMPGERLVETKIAESLKTSRMPVREALHRLMADGLVVGLTRGGAIAAECSFSDIEDLYNLRVVLECHAIALAAQRITEDELAQLDSLIEQTRFCLKRMDENGIVTLNGQFHVVIEKAAGSPRLLEIMSNLHDHIQRYRRMAIHGKTEMEEALEGHVKMVEALRARDPELAAAVSKEYILKAKTRALERFSSVSGERPSPRAPSSRR